MEVCQILKIQVRAVGRLSSAPYDLSTMATTSSGGAMSTALLNMNTFAYGVATMRRPYAQQAQQRMAAQPRKKLYEQANMVRRVKEVSENFEIWQIAKTYSTSTLCT